MAAARRVRGRRRRPKPAEIVGPSADTGFLGPGKRLERRRQLAAEVIEDHVPMRMAGNFDRVPGQPEGRRTAGRPDSIAAARDIRRGTAGVTSSQLSSSTLPMMHSASSLALPRLCRQHLDVADRVVDPFLPLRLVECPADELFGRRLDGTQDVVVLRFGWWSRLHGHWVWWSRKRGPTWSFWQASLAASDVLHLLYGVRSRRSGGRPCLV